MSVFCRHLVFCDRFFNAASGQWASGADSGDGPGASVFCRSVSRRLSASSCFLLFSAMVSLLSAIWASMYKTSTDRYVLTHPVRAISRNIQSVPVTWATTSPRRTDAAAPSQNSACEKNLTFVQCVQTSLASFVFHGFFQKYTIESPAMQPHFSILTPVPQNFSSSKQRQVSLKTRSPSQCYFSPRSQTQQTQKPRQIALPRFFYPSWDVTEDA